eukprot:sb/3461786/
MEVFILEGDDNDDVRVEIKELKYKLKDSKKLGKQKGVDAEFALVVAGSTLRFALEDNLKEEFTKLAMQCGAVICCRVTPLQKALVVRLVKNYLPAGSDDQNNITLAIGDGANDVSMIREAHIGVGISGKEGRQAVLASDFCFAQFRFLERLLLVHGHWSYIRMCKFLSYFFFKNFAFTLVQLFYSPFCGFSAQTILDPIYITLYNVVFTSMPVMLVGVLDQELAVENAPPEVYEVGQLNQLFNQQAFALAGFHGFVVAAACLFIPYQMFAESISYTGMDQQSMYFIGTAIAGIITIVVNFQVALETTLWTVYNHILTWGSICMWFLLFLIFCSPFAYTFSPETFFYFDSLYRVVETRTWWLIMFLTLVICIFPAIGYRLYVILTQPTLLQEVMKAIREDRLVRHETLCQAKVDETVCDRSTGVHEHSSESLPQCTSVSGFFRSYELTVGDSVDYDQIIEDTCSAAKPIINESVRRHPIKAQLSISISFYKDVDGQRNAAEKVFRSQCEPVIVGDNIDDFLKRASVIIRHGVEVYERYGSGWIFDGHQASKLELAKYSPLSASGFVPLPKTLRDMRSLINIQSNDNKCFLYCILAHLFPVKINQDRRTKYLKHEDKVAMGDVQFPVKLKDIPKIEKLNNFSISVFQWCRPDFEKGETECVIPLKHGSGNGTRIDLLYVEDEYNSHYLLIKDFNSFMRHRTKYHNTMFYCRKCLHGFVAENKQKAHSELCNQGINQVTVMPKPGFIEFEATHKQDEKLFRIYYDFECLTVPYSTCVPSGSSTTKVQKHVPCAFAIVAVSKFPEFNEPPVYNIEKDKETRLTTLTNTLTRPLKEIADHLPQTPFRHKGANLMETRNQLSKRHLRPSSAHTSTRGYAFAGTAGMGKMIQDGEAFVQKPRTDKRFNASQIVNVDGDDLPPAVVPRLSQAGPLIE